MTRDDGADLDVSRLLYQARQERDEARTQLAEREALLRECLAKEFADHRCSITPDCPACDRRRRIEAALGDKG